jgi:hypothetical protein
MESTGEVRLASCSSLGEGAHRQRAVSSIRSQGRFNMTQRQIMKIATHPEGGVATKPMKEAAYYNWLDYRPFTRAEDEVSDQMEAEKEVRHNLN